MVTSQDQLCDAFSGGLKQLGYHGFDAFSVKSETACNGDHTENLFVCDYGLEVFLPYINEGWVSMDPAFKKIERTSVPFDYVDFLRRAQFNTSVKWQLGVLRLQRVHQAWSIPLNITGATRGVTIYMRGKGKAVKRKFTETRDETQLMAGIFMETLVDLNKTNQKLQNNAFANVVDVASISRRETDCLHWAAHGKTNWAIGKILKISENTVRYHLKNAFLKLGANSRSQAVSRALHEGVIVL